MYLVNIYESESLRGIVPTKSYYTDSWKEIKRLCSGIAAFEQSKENQIIIKRKHGKVVFAEFTCGTYSIIATYIKPLSEYEYVDIVD